MIRVMVVDDHELFRQALCAVSDQEHDMTVVAVCGDGQEAERLTQARPDVVVTDLVMPRLDGAATTARVRGQQPELPVLVLTATPHRPARRRRAGRRRRAVLVKNLDRDELPATTAVGAKNACPARGAGIRNACHPSPARNSASTPSASSIPGRAAHRPFQLRAPVAPGSGQRRNRSAISSQHNWRGGGMFEFTSRTG